MYVAVNYAVANCIMLVGSGGKVIVDTTESIQAAEEIAAEFRAITQAETKAIIYTHHHTDHVAGSWVCVHIMYIMYIQHHLNHMVGSRVCLVYSIFNTFNDL